MVEFDIICQSFGFWRGTHAYLRCLRLEDGLYECLLKSKLIGLGLAVLSKATDDLSFIDLSSMISDREDNFQKVA